MDVLRASDGVYYGITPRGWWSEVDRYLAIDRGNGWEMHHLGFNYDIRGFAPYVGGVIITACTPDSSLFSGCVTGLVMRVTSAEEITVLRQFRLTDP